jgi:hypothetical protein
MAITPLCSPDHPIIGSPDSEHMQLDVQVLFGVFAEVRQELF